MLYRYERHYQLGHVDGSERGHGEYEQAEDQGEEQHPLIGGSRPQISQDVRG